jgi:hyperosmotically inducible protein
MRVFTLGALALLSMTLLVACSQQRANTPAMKSAVEQGLKQIGVDNINVDEDRDKGVITLKGEVPSEDVKERAQQIAQQSAPGRVIANELAVRPPGNEEAAKKAESSTDDAIENHFKAIVASNHWDDQHIRFDAKNGVLTLKGDVDTPQQRADVEKTAVAIPGVLQVVNELEVKHGRGAGAGEAH